MEKYTNIFYQPGEKTVLSFRTGRTVYEETFADGMLCAGGYNTAGFPLNVLTNVPTRIAPRRLREPSSFHLEIDGRNVDNAWRLSDFSDTATANGRQGVLTLVNEACPVTVRVVTELDGTGMFTRYFEIANTGDKPLSVSRLTLLSGAVESMEKNKLPELRDPASLYEYGYFDGDVWTHEGEFAWHPLLPDEHAFATGFTRGRYRHPVLFVRNRVTGTIFFSQIGYSGGSRYALDLNASPDADTSLLSLSLDITGYSPLTVLAPGETLRTPEVYFGMLTGDLDDAVNEMNDHLRRSVLNLPETDGSALLVGAGMGAEHDMSVETTKAFMRQMKEMGAEVFIIDGGWQCPPGAEMSWYSHNGSGVPHPDRYPGNAFRELKDYAASIGLKFGLWMEPERFGKFAAAYEKHPDWFPKTFFGNPCDGFIDLTIPEAAAWMENEIARVIEEYGLDLFRLDHNGTPDYFGMRDCGTGITECTSLRHVDALYGIFRRLKARFPDVIFENCAGGGGRTDLGMMKAFHHTWVSDWQRLPRSLTITNGMTLVLPPERVDRLFAGMNSHEIGSLAVNMRNTMLGHMSLNVIHPMAAETNPETMAFVKHSVALYKDFIRPFLPTCKIYHHTPEAARALAEGFSCLEIAAADKTRAVLHAALLTSPKNEVHTVYPRGLDRSRTYRVTFDNSGETVTRTGDSLVTEGIRLRLPAALTSELILCEAAD